jgi:hypothetical protein
VETSADTSEAVVYERRSGRWFHEFVPMRGAAYVAPAHSDSLGLVLAVVGADIDTGEANALHFMAQQPKWRVLRKVVRGGPTPVFEPTLTFAGPRGVLSWRTLLAEPGGMRWQARAMVGRLEVVNEPLVTIDSSIAYVAAPLNPGPGVYLWVSEHAGDDGSSKEIRVTTDSAGSASVLTRVPSPFQGFFAAALLSPSELWIAGPLPGRTDRDPAVVTLLLRLRVQCPRGARHSN